MKYTVFPLLLLAVFSMACMKDDKICDILFSK